MTRAKGNSVPYLLLLVAVLAVAACERSGSPGPVDAAPVPTAESGASADPGPAALSDRIPLPELTADEQKQAAQFYRGKTVRIVVGSGAGGGFDLTARLLSRHIVRHIPGQPTVIVENMPGGAGIVAANHLFHAAEKTGLTIGLFHEVQVMNQLTGAEGVQFDLRKFNWLGSSYVDPNVCLVRADAPAATFDAILHSRTPILFGATAPGSNSYDVGRGVAAATGANLKIVGGYSGTNEVRLGIERRELHGTCFGWEAIKLTMGQWLRDKFVRVVVQNGPTPIKDLPGVPSASTFAKDEDSKVLLRLVDAPGAMAKPFALPPGVDATRVRVMRRAFLTTFQDSAFLREAQAMQLAFHPKTAAEIQQIIEEVLATPPRIAAKYKQMIGE